MDTSWEYQGVSNITQPLQTISTTQTIGSTLSSTDKKQKKQQQPRQLLSCTKCRERKVKCDRTKPCSACCARGLPKECHFVLGEGAEFGPIQQSVELRRLRAENQRLKERLLAGRGSVSDDSDNDEATSASKAGVPGRRMSRQRRFRANDQTDSLYFGSPGLASVIADFANLHVEPKSLSHAMPRGADMFAAQDAMYPFPTLWPAMSRTEGLLKCLPPPEQLFQHLDCFTRMAQGFAFPYLPEELTRKEVEHFLENVQENAEEVPDLLGLIFAALALGVQSGTVESRSRNQEEPSQAQGRGGEIFSVAAMQALRLSSFTSRPSLKSIQALIMLAPYLTNSGRFLDAWTFSGITIRLSHSIGLHRNPRYLDPVPSLRECTVRSTLWWWILHMDQQYSMTLGRPLGISGIGDCPPPDPLTTDPVALRLGEFFDQLTILGRQILSSSQLTDMRIDMFTDKLIALWDTMPDSLQFNKSWILEETEIPEWPMETRAANYYCSIHNYIILLNRQRLESGGRSPEYHSPMPRHPSIGDYFLQIPSYSPTAPVSTIPRGRPLVIDSCLALLDALLFFYERVPSVLVDWTIGQQAFNACMILLLDALDSGNLQHMPRVEDAYGIFVEMDKMNIHQLAGLAVSRISQGLQQLHDMLENGKPSTKAESTSVAKDQRQSSVSWAAPKDDPKSHTSELFHEAVMGPSGMFLLEDHGLQTSMPRRSASTGSFSLPMVPSQNIMDHTNISNPHAQSLNPRRDSAHPLAYLPGDRGRNLQVPPQFFVGAGQGQGQNGMWQQPQFQDQLYPQPRRKSQQQPGKRS